MPCCLGIIALVFPRAALIVMWLMGYTTTAFETKIWPLSGFILLPYTTCGYAIAVNSFGAVKGAGLALVIIGVILDIGSHGGSAYTSR